MQQLNAKNWLEPKDILLMDGYDLRTVLGRQIHLRDFILAKVTQLNLKGEAFLGAREYLAEEKSTKPS